MAHFARMISVDSTKYVTSTSRYAKSKILQYSEEKHTTFETYKRKPSSHSEDDQWTEIMPVHQYRPDLVSVEIYGVPDFWWRILEYNGMKDILEFKSGRNIRLPGDVLWQ